MGRRRHASIIEGGRKKEVCFDSALTELRNSNVHVIRLDLTISKFQVHAYSIRPAQYTTSCPLPCPICQGGLLLFGHHITCLIHLPADAHQHDDNITIVSHDTYPASLSIHAALDFATKQKMFMLAQLSKTRSTAAQFRSSAETHKSPPWLCPVLHAMHGKSSPIFLPPFFMLMQYPPDRAYNASDPHRRGLPSHSITPARSGRVLMFAHGHQSGFGTICAGPCT